MDEMCSQCLFDCKNLFVGTGVCNNFKRRIGIFELEELNAKIRRQNLNIPRFAKEHNLKLKYLKKMLKGKHEMNYKVLYLLNHRLNEKSEWAKYIDREYKLG